MNEDHQAAQTTTATKKQECIVSEELRTVKFQLEDPSYLQTF